MWFLRKLHKTHLELWLMLEVPKRLNMGVHGIISVYAWFYAFLHGFTIRAQCYTAHLERSPKASS